jgi:hypothetical protein
METQIEEMDRETPDQHIHARPVHMIPQDLRDRRIRMVIKAEIQEDIPHHARPVPMPRMRIVRRDRVGIRATVRWDKADIRAIVRLVQVLRMRIVRRDRVDTRVIVHWAPPVDIRAIDLSVQVLRMRIVRRDKADIRDRADIRVTVQPAKADFHKDLPRAALEVPVRRAPPVDIRVIVPRDRAALAVQDLRKAAAALPGIVPVMILLARVRKMRILSDPKKITDMVHEVHQGQARAELEVLQNHIRISLQKSARKRRISLQGMHMRRAVKSLQKMQKKMQPNLQQL